MEGYYDWIRNHREDILRGNNWQRNQRIEDEIRTLKNNLNSNTQHIMLLGKVRISRSFLPKLTR